MHMRLLAADDCHVFPLSQEYAAGTYSVVPFWLAEFLAEVPYIVLSALGCECCCCPCLAWARPAS